MSAPLSTSPFKDFHEPKASNIHDFESNRIRTTIDEEKAQPTIDQVHENIVDWDGPNDPDNPLNWPLSKSFGHVIIVAVLSMIV